MTQITKLHATAKSNKRLQRTGISTPLIYNLPLTQLLPRPLKRSVGWLLLVINMKKTLSVCCLVLVGNIGVALSQSSKPRGYDPLLTKLASVKWLSNHNQGFGGSNEFYKLSKEFLESHDPSDFKRMVHSQNPIVKAMGLLCLAQVDPDKVLAYPLIALERQRTGVSA